MGGLNSRMEKVLKIDQKKKLFQLKNIEKQLSMDSIKQSNIHVFVVMKGEKKQHQKYWKKQQAENSK